MRFRWLIVPAVLYDLVTAVAAWGQSSGSDTLSLSYPEMALTAAAFFVSSVVVVRVKHPLAPAGGTIVLLIASALTLMASVFWLPIRVR